MTSSSSEITKLVKEHAPMHYILRILSFSSLKTLLDECNNNCITSSEFSSGGCKWVLKLYLNGKKDDDGDGHISMYLRLIDDLKPGEIVTAVFRFYVYNQRLGNYFMKQDATGKQFSLVKNEWGISKVLPIDEVMDSSNGYVLDDCCVVGVEVFPSKSECKVGTLAVALHKSVRQYTWKVAKFSGLGDAEIFSPIYTVEGIPWCLRLHPQGDNRSKDKSISIFLFLKDEDGGITAGGDKVFVKYEISIKDQLLNNDYKRNASVWFDANTSNGWGYSDYLSLSELEDHSKGYLKNDELIIKVNFEAMLRLKNI